MSTSAAADAFAARVATFLRHAEVTQQAVPNLRTRIDSVGSGDARLPVTVNHGEPNDSWVCSPYTAFVRYAAEEAARLGHPLMTAPLALLCRAVGAQLRRGGIDHAVGLNNWALSTNLYPRLQVQALRAQLDECAQRWPDCAIWLRSLNRRYTADWLAALQEMGCVVVPSRQVYLYDHIDTRRPGHANLQRDLQLTERSPWTPSAADEWSDTDFARAEALYAMLYLQKYSRLNPAYSARWLRTWSRAGLLELTGYRDAHGALLAVVGIFGSGDTLTAPIVGYDTSLPQRLGLYRLLMATVYRAAAARGVRINLSTGAAGFKRLRGGIGTMEYSAVWVRHLRGRHRRSVRLLGAIARGIGEPVLRRYEL